MARRRFKPHEAAILRTLEYSGFSMTTRELALECRMGWRTAKKTLEGLHKEKYVYRKQRGNRIYSDKNR